MKATPLSNRSTAMGAETDSVMKWTNRLELTWRAVPPTEREYRASRNESRWLALRLLHFTVPLSLLGVWAVSMLEPFRPRPVNAPMYGLLILICNGLSIALLIQSLLPRRTFGPRYQLREKGLFRGRDVVLAWPHYKAFRVIEVGEHQRRIEFIGRDNYPRAIPMPGDVPEAVVLEAIAKHLEPYSLSKHGVVERHYPFPPLAAWMLVGMAVLVLVCLFEIRHETAALLARLPRDERGVLFVLLSSATGPLAFALWYPLARSQLVGIRRQQIVLALLVATMCAMLPAMAIQMVDPLIDMFQTLERLPHSSRQEAPSP